MVCEADGFHVAGLVDSKNDGLIVGTLEQREGARVGIVDGIVGADVERFDGELDDRLLVGSTVTIDGLSLGLLLPSFDG